MRVWRGSDIELFGSTPGTFDIGQVFLAPAVGDEPACGYKPDGDNQVPAPQIQVASQDTEAGYDLQALVPLSLLSLDAAAGRFLLELQVSSNPTGRKRVYGTRFNSERAYQNNTDYGLFVFELEEE